ncbi:MAG TPA: hypothetical protein VJT49_18570 [Amycolatopsis sp.]|uniref:hypothetical protein n=1 Tax=Amycolatopsis sp. TaxID=37632 RepID=UPI002B49776D|nr:hypothetical protein [Amycolatopsis sp.]HKS47072.1 hypothetical protein [Amycolatopsis sp.]
MHQALNEPRAEPEPGEEDPGRDAALVAAAGGVQSAIFRLLSTLGEHRAKSDALIEACVACLEAAQCLAGLVVDDAVVTESPDDPRGQEAVYAMRAATLAVRFALAE